MSDLQLGLLAVGVVVVAAVLAYNKWQERRYRRQAEAGFRSSHEDVLMRGAGAPAPGRESTKPAGPERIEPVFDARAASHTGIDAQAILSDALDHIVSLEAAEGLAGDAVLAAADVALTGCPKAVQWEGFDAAHARWEPLRADAGYSMLRTGLQLVDRRGAVSAEELAAFGSGMQEAAAALGARVTIPDAGHALARAAELDRFCSDVDIQIALNLVSAGAPFPGAKIRSLAEAAGLALESDGIFRRRDGSGRTLYELANFEPVAFQADAMKALATRGLTVQLDVPRAPGGERTFGQFSEFAQQLARALGASIVDDNRRPVGASAFDAIRSQLRDVHKAMETRGIEAGGGLALRLFS